MAYLRIVSPNGSNYAINLDQLVYDWGANAVLFNNGWCRLPNGLVFLWMTRIDVENIINVSDHKFDSGWYTSSFAITLRTGFACSSCINDASPLYCEYLLQYFIADGSGLYWKLTGLTDSYVGSATIGYMSQIAIGTET